MTQVLFEPEIGRLRLDRETFGTLADWAAGVHTVGPALGELRAAGVINDGQAHATVAPGLAAVGSPVCRLRIDMLDCDGAAETAEAWVSGEPAAGMLLPLPNELTEFITLTPVFLPVLLARFVELGPRPRLLAQPVRATENQIARLTTGDRDAAVAELVDGVPDELTRNVVTDLASELRRYWAIRASWESSRGELTGRMVRVLDTAAGLWLLQSQEDPQREVETIWPTTPTTVWRYITRLLPDDDDLG